MKLTKTITSLALIILFSYPAIRHLLMPGFFPMHDDTQVARVAQMAKAWQEGQFPVRWVDGLGYGFGYPIFNFYNPLPYYFGAFFVLAGFDALVATKIMFIFGILLAGISMFLLVKHFFGELGGILSSLFYLYAPYHATQLFVRGSVAEAWAYGVLPLVFLAVVKRNVFLGGISLALLILSHNLTALMTLPIIFTLFAILILLEKKDRRKSLFYCFIVSLSIGLSLSAFFWLPAMVEKKYTSVDQMVREKFNPLVHFVYPEQLWASPWGFGGSAPGLVDGMSFQIGKLHLLMSFVSLITMVYFWKKEKRMVRILLFTFYFLLFTFFMMLPISKPVWQIFYPVLSYLQFPWRFLTFTSLSTSFLAGSVVLLIHRLQGEIPQSLAYWGMSRRPTEGGVAQPRMKNSPEPWVLGEASIHPWGEKSKVFPMTFEKFSIIKSLSCFVSPPLQGWKFIWGKNMIGKVVFFVSLVLLIGGLIFINKKYFIPKYIYKTKASDFLTQEKLQWEVSSRSDEYLPYQFSRPKNQDELFVDKFVLETEGEIREIKRTASFYKLVVKTNPEGNLKINTVYFPGWKAWIDSQEVQIDKTDFLINLKLPVGEHKIELKFINTPIRTIGNLISLVSLLGLMGFVVYRKSPPGWRH